MQSVAKRLHRGRIVCVTDVEDEFHFIKIIKSVVKIPKHTLKFIMLFSSHDFWWKRSLVSGYLMPVESLNLKTGSIAFRSSQISIAC